MLITFDQTLVAINAFDDVDGGKSDTIQALVISDNSAISASIKNMSGEDIFTLIDSLLDANAIPVDLIKEINTWLNVTGNVFVVDRKMFKLKPRHEASS